MAYTQTDLDNLQAAIAKGARRLKMGDEEVEYRSLAEMRQIAAQIEISLGLRTGTRVFRPVTETGWR